MDLFKRVCFKLPENDITSERYKEYTGNTDTQTCISFDPVTKDYSVKGPISLYGISTGWITKNKSFSTQDYQNNKGWKEFNRVYPDRKKKEIYFDFPYVMGGEAEFTVNISEASESDQTKLFDFFDKIGTNPFEKKYFI